MSWLTKIIGREDPASAPIAGVDPTHFALRTADRPLEQGVGSTFAVAGYSGVIAAALGANSEVFQFRWTSNLMLGAIRSVEVGASVSTTAFALGVPVALEMRVARDWTVAGSGGTRITPFISTKRRRQTFSSVAASDVGISTTGALTAGTKVLDGTAARTVCGQPGSVVGSIIDPVTLWRRDTADEFPFVFKWGEGFVIRSVEVPGTGTWKLWVMVEWDEIDTFATEGNLWRWTF